MAFNRYMHPRNPYKDSPPDFKALATCFADFRSHCTLDSNGKVHVNFHEDDAVRALTRAIFKKDFELDVELPKGCLVPRIPQRLNYLLWIDDVLKRNKLSQSNQFDVLGIDIGTGASCVYALLGARHFNWRFVATDADDLAAETAHRNVVNNELTPFVRVAHVSETSVLKDLFRQFPSTDFTFCMCNPPFFEIDETEKRFIPSSDQSSVVLSNQSEPGRAPPRSATMARRNELEVEGGEVAFVGKMIEESVILRTQVRIYTSMLGKKSSVSALRGQLQRTEGARHTLATLSQGRTQRWIIAWTFCPHIDFEQADSSISLSLPVSDLPLATRDPLLWMETELRALDVQTLRQDGPTIGRYSLFCSARGCTWTNQRSRRRVEQHMAAPPDKRPRMSTANASVQVCLGEGDGRDSLAVSGAVEIIERQGTTVAVQTYLPSTTPSYFLVRFNVRLCDDVIVLEHMAGARQSLHQLMQYFRNRLKARK